MSELLRYVQRVLAILYLPHELAHYVAIWPWSPDPELNLSVPREDWSHQYIPAMAEVNGTIPTGTSKLKVRFAALAPTILYALIGALALQSPILHLGSVQYFLTWLAFSFAMMPSGTDLHTAVYPEPSIKTGYFGAENSDADIKWDICSVVIGTMIATFLVISPLFL